MPPGAAPGLPAYYGRIWRFPGPATLCKGAIYYITGSTHSYCKTGQVELPLVIHYSYIISCSKLCEKVIAAQTLDLPLNRISECPKLFTHQDICGKSDRSYVGFSSMRIHSSVLSLCKFDIALRND